MLNPLFVPYVVPLSYPCYSIVLSYGLCNSKPPILTWSPQGRAMCKAIHCKARHARSVSSHGHTRWLIRDTPPNTKYPWKSAKLVSKAGPIPGKIIYCSFVCHNHVQSNRAIRCMPYSFNPNTVYLLKPIDAYMRQWTAPSLDKFMIYCPFATSHYLNQSWLIVGWTPNGIYSIEFLFENQRLSLTKMHLKVWSAKYRPFCLDLRVLACYFDRRAILVGYWEGIER